MNDYIGNELELFKHAHHWKNYYSKFFKHLLKGDVLEVGAGIGETSHYLCDGTQKSWTCLEPDEKLAKEIVVKKEQGYLPTLIDVKVGTLSSIEQTKKFDAIIYIDVIEHIEKDAEELQLASTYLKPGGVIIILVPAHNYLYSEFDKSIGHFRRYNKQMLRAAIPGSLRKVDLRYLDTIGLFASLTNKLFLKQSYPTLKQIKFWDNYIVPVSKIVDAVLFYAVGKTVIGIWQKVEGQIK